jgi:hypothetical protein
MCAVYMGLFAAQYLLHRMVLYNKRVDLGPNKSNVFRWQPKCLAETSPNSIQAQSTFLKIFWQITGLARPPTVAQPSPNSIQARPTFPKIFRQIAGLARSSAVAQPSSNSIQARPTFPKIFRQITELARSSAVAQPSSNSIQARPTFPKIFWQITELARPLTKHKSWCVCLSIEDTSVWRYQGVSSIMRSVHVGLFGAQYVSY